MRVRLRELSSDNILPVSLLCGFLGAGKTTLLKHVLESKHSEEEFRCAVIVNDMAALNIDKSLIDQSAVLQSEEVIAMQNGCFCCTLQNDLVEQIIELAMRNMFNYILIEASGVSEPSQIAKLFNPCDDQHDHDEEHKDGFQLHEVARLDTCVTVVDAAEFYNNLGSMKHYEEGDVKGSIAELMVEQVEYSNVVILNKTDLVNGEQKDDILERISVLNSKAKVLQSYQSKIDVMEILDTGLYKPEDLNENLLFAISDHERKAEPEEPDNCCVKSLEKDGKKCCKKKVKDDQTLNSGLSEIVLGAVPEKNKEKIITRHEARFNINSFIYRSRRPFHPTRLYNTFFEPYFMFEDDSEIEEADSDLENLQTEAATKQTSRIEVLGELMRSKGFIWLATSQLTVGAWQQAGNILKVQPAGPWLCEIRDNWAGTPYEAVALQKIQQNNGEVFILIIFNMFFIILFRSGPMETGVKSLYS